MESEVDTHSFPNEDLMKLISQEADSGSNMRYHEVHSHQPYGTREPVKLESSFPSTQAQLPIRANGDGPYYDTYFPQQTSVPASQGATGQRQILNSYPPSPHQGVTSPIQQSGLSTSPRNTDSDPSLIVGPLTTSDLNSLSPKTTLDKINLCQRNQKESLIKIKTMQKQVITNPNKASYDTLFHEHRFLKEQIDIEVKALQKIYTQTILPPMEIHRLLILVQELKIQQTQLELLHQELHQLTQPMTPPRCIATLVVSQEPFPIVITKGKQLDDDPVIVQLLSGSNVEFQSFSQMKVAMVWENHQSKANNQKNIECDTQTLDAFNRVAKWHLKFLNGTRKNSVTLRFGMQVQVVQPGGPVTVTVESHSTRPFIVITNECQWEESEGSLLKRDAFGEQAEISWQQFANVLQRHFLRATRQDPLTPSRCLSLVDFEYIHSKFFDSQPIITPKAYSNFWNWFGKTVKKLRYQRHILPLWQNGSIHGFLSREAVQDILKDQEPGTFLVRFSERHPGDFAVAYNVGGRDPNTCVRHYLIQPDDTSGNKKTLPDFLYEQQSFRQLLQIGTENENGVKEYKKVDKDTALDTFMSKRPNLAPSSGYDSDVLALQSNINLLQIEKELLDAE